MIRLKIQNDITIEAAKISALSSGKIDQYEYLTVEEILPSNQKQIVEQTSKIYLLSFGKGFSRTNKNN